MKPRKAHPPVLDCSRCGVAVGGLGTRLVIATGPLATLRPDARLCARCAEGLADYLAGGWARVPAGGRAG